MPRRVHERLHIHIVGVILITCVCTNLDGLTNVNRKVPRKSILRSIYQLRGPRSRIVTLPRIQSIYFDLQQLYLVTCCSQLPFLHPSLHFGHFGLPPLLNISTLSFQNVGLHISHLCDQVPRMIQVNKLCPYMYKLIGLAEKLTKGGVVVAW